MGDLVDRQPPAYTGRFRYLRFHGATGKYRGRYGKRGLWRVARSLKDYRRDSFTYFGDAVRRLFKHDAFAIATLSHEGTYSPLIDVRGYLDSTTLMRYVIAFDSVGVLPPTDPGSLEAALAGRGFCAAFLDLHHAAMHQKPVRTRALDYSKLPALAMRWGVGYDGFLFLRRTFGLNAAPAHCE